MGIESEQLVFDYLSRVGDLAHSTSMTAAERARLVSGLRGEIDRLRSAEGGAQSKGAVRKILTRLGDPEDVVAGAHGGSPLAGSAAGGTGTGRTAGTGGGPVAGSAAGERPRISLRKRPSVPRPGRASREAEQEPQQPAPTAAYGASAPHLAGMDELGPQESDPDWWRADAGPYSGAGGGGGGTFGELVPGFIGGIELPEVLKQPSENVPVPPQSRGPGTVPGAAAPGAAPGAVPGGGAVAGVGGGTEAVAGPRGWRQLLRGRGGPVPGVAVAGPRAGGFVEWVAVLLLVAGAFIGSLIPLGLGWLAAWWSPRLSRTEAKWAAAGMPGLVAGGALVWVWGRMAGRWGEAIPPGDDGLQRVLAEDWPVLLRAAAVASALFLVWRARRPRRG